MSNAFSSYNSSQLSDTLTDLQLSFLLIIAFNFSISSFISLTPFSCISITISACLKSLSALLSFSFASSLFIIIFIYNYYHKICSLKLQLFPPQDIFCPLRYQPYWGFSLNRLSSLLFACTSYPLLCSSLFYYIINNPIIAHVIK